jgi:FKBP-type peptidyl-prolyl cis-trans isomerase
MKIEKLNSTTGPSPKAGDTVTVHYTGWLTDGAKFDSSVDRDDPFAFVLGAGQVIQGWDEGVATLKVGEKARLTIPPEKAYGANGYPGAIPPDATLIFEVELLSIS